ncbi:unnamed protein product [Polarella glacialis]|uniref:J domain-containing protein n=1 Tax=Polarella glacialis TaxID=89957 RepID=A0A813J4C1_POLGL|nr:unnamed protein product [Polarella glacialis]
MSVGKETAGYASDDECEPKRLPQNFGALTGDCPGKRKVFGEETIDYGVRQSSSGSASKKFRFLDAILNPLLGNGSSKRLAPSQTKPRTSFDRHVALLNLVKKAQVPPTLKSDLDILRESHRFLREETDEDGSWEAKLARRYYDRLFKEYVISDLSGYRKGNVGFRWRTEAEVIRGKGQFICGHRSCESKAALSSYEVDFKYVEASVNRRALVKVRLCEECAYKLHYRRLKAAQKQRSKLEKEARRSKHSKRSCSREHGGLCKDEIKSEVVSSDGESEKGHEVAGSAVLEDSQLSEAQQEKMVAADRQLLESLAWRGPDPEARTREDDFDDYLRQARPGLSETPCTSLNRLNRLKNLWTSQDVPHERRVMGVPTTAVATWRELEQFGNARWVLRYGHPSDFVGPGSSDAIPEQVSPSDNSGQTQIDRRAAFSPPDRAQKPSSEETESQGDPAVPKTREERLRDFYARRQQPLVQAPGRDGDQTRVLESKKGSVALELEQRTPEQLAEALSARKKGNDLHEARDYEGAVEQYTAAIKAAPSSILHSNRAAAYMMLGWWSQALRDTRAALRKDPDNFKARERHGKVLVAMDNLDAAAEVVAELELLDAEDLPSNLQQSQSLPGLGWLVKVARNPCTLDDCRAVLQVFGSKAELASPLGTRLRKTLVKALVERSDAVDNQRKIRPALQANRRTEADGDEIQEITPFAEEAVRVTGELLQDHPDDAELRYWRGRALVRLGRHSDAESEFQRGLKDDPENQQIMALMETVESLEGIKQRANAFYKEGKLSEAVQLYTRGIECDPDCVDARTVATLYYNRSAALRKQGEPEQALQDANMALVLHAKWTKALYRRGILLLECGRFAEALTELKVVQRADPTFDDDLEEWLRRAHHWLSKPRGERNYYKFMKLPMDATKEEIKKQYRRLCLLWHPDKSDLGNSSAEDLDRCRERFEELQTAHRFLMDDEQRDSYDFGIWKDRPVRHHIKIREKVKDTWDKDESHEEVGPRGHFNWGDKHLVEDDKVESIYWGETGCPAWLKEKRREHQRQRYGQE